MTTAPGVNTAPGGVGGGGSSQMNGDHHRIAGGGGVSFVELQRAAGAAENLMVAGGGGGAGACGAHLVKGGVGGSDRSGGAGESTYNEGMDHAPGGTGGAAGTGTTARGLDGVGGGGGGGAGRKGGGAGGGSTVLLGGARSGAGGGGAGSSHLSPLVDQGGIRAGEGRGDGLVTLKITPVEAQAGHAKILFGDPASEALHGLVQFPLNQANTGMEADVLRRHSTTGDAEYNFRYDTLLKPKREVKFTVTETYPGGGLLTSRNYAIYVNNKLVHTRSSSSTVETLKTFAFTVDGSQFAGDQTMKVMIKNTDRRWGSSIHRIEVAVNDAP